jgi:NAD(P)H-dependent flavin oxidoreductase YrpB (nitropropane dioxygenase family)
MPIRVLRNLAADKVVAMEREGASREAINAYADEFYCHEDPDKAIMPAGQGAGVIRDILGVREVMDMLIREARVHYGRVGGLLGEESE